MSLLKVLLLCALVVYVGAESTAFKCANGSPAPSHVLFSACADGRNCYMRDTSEYDIVVTFTPNSNVQTLRSELLTSLPIDKKDNYILYTYNPSICDNLYDSFGLKNSCPLNAGKTYTLKLHFLAVFPPEARLVSSVDFRFALKEGDREVACFEIENVYKVL